MLASKHNICFQKKLASSHFIQLCNDWSFYQRYVTAVSLKSETLEGSKASQYTAEVGVLKQIKTKSFFS